MKKIVLITGGTGYIGSHCVVAFEQAGYKTVIVDNLDNSSKEVLEGIKNIIGYYVDFYDVDLRNKEKLEEVFRKYKLDGVVHFAGLKAVGESCEKPLKYIDNNVVGSIKLFELMNKYGVKNIIFSSTATVYNYDNNIPYVENQEIGKTTNTYSSTKFIIEKILIDLSKFSNFNVITLRYFNPIGAHKSGYIGEDPNDIPNNLVPFIMKVALGKINEVKIFGNDYNTKDGTGVRDYIDVIDLIDGHLKSYNLFGNKLNGFFKEYNLGSGVGTSVLEIIKTVEEVIGIKIPYSIAKRREGDLSEFYCNPSKAKNDLGWVTNTPVKESLENTWNYINKNKSMTNKLKLGVLITTMNEGIHRVKNELLKQLTNVDEIVISHQITDENILPENINEIKKYHKNIKYVFMNEKGLSKNRNNALKKSSADICYICDDDLNFKEGFEDIIKNEYEKHNFDIITFQAENEKGIKHFNAKEGLHDRLSVLKVWSWGITFRRSIFFHNNLEFDTNFGLGTDAPVGEENIFLTDCYKNGFNMYHSSKSIVIHPDESSGIDYRDGLIIGRIKVWKRLYGFLGGLFALFYFSITHYKFYKGKYSFKEFFTLSFKSLINDK